jgi:two-component system cell cycle sensor histidine kinase/response regulator CckA
MGASALQLTGAALRYALDHVPTACWIERRGTIRYANPALVTFVGARDRDAIVDRPSAYLLEHTSGWPEIEPETILAGLAPASGEATLRRAGGRVPVQVTRTLVAFEGEVMLLNAVCDISTERSLRAALRDLDRRHRQLVDSDLIGIIEIDAEKILTANDSFLRMVGRSREELSRGELKWREMTPPESRPIDDEIIAQMASAGDCVPIEKEFYRSDGTRVAVLLRCLTVAGGPDWRATCVVVDLSARRKAEALEAERLRFESVGMLAAGVAHLLNNLLTAIIGNAALLLEDEAAISSRRARDLVHDIVAAGQEGANLAAQLLAYSGQGRVIVSSPDCATLIQQQVEALRPKLPANVQLKLELAENLPHVTGDPRQLAFVVEAVLTNAIEAVSPAGGEILIQSRLERVAPGTLTSRSGEPLPEGEYCLLRIVDNGVGMDAYALVHAFDPFFTTKFQGRGLGLAAVAGIIGASRGAVRIASEPGKGSDVRIYLPPEASQ